MVGAVLSEVKKLEEESGKNLYEFGEYEWEHYCLVFPMSMDFMRKYKDSINWKSVSSNQKMSEEFMEEFADRIYWSSVCVTKTLNEDFIEKYIDKISWGRVGIFQKLPEDFIRKYKDKLFWGDISKRQVMSFDFIMEHIEDIDLPLLNEGVSMEHLTDEQKELLRGTQTIRESFGSVERKRKAKMYRNN